MSTQNDFRKYYATISTQELLIILDNPDAYQPLAVVAAQDEFANRQLSETEIYEARQALVAIQLQKERDGETVKAVESKIKGLGSTLIETVNPIQSGIPSTEKTIRYIVLLFGGIFLYLFINDFRTHLIYLKDFPGFPLISSLYFLPLILLPIGTFTFWRRKKIGWTLLTFYVTFSAVGNLGVFIQSFTWEPTGFFSRPSLITCIIQLLFLIGTLYVLCKESIREIFSVEKQGMTTTISIAGIVTFLFMLSNT